MSTEASYIRKIRYTVQALFLAFTLFIGFRFYWFVRHFDGQGNPLVGRPPSVEGFLPIGGMMSLKYFIFTGMVEPFHPAGLVIFIAVVATSLVLKKGFCGWLCPVGTVSQYAWMAGEKVFSRNYRMWRYADFALRSMKYLLMAFFLYVIWLKMPPEALSSFFSSDYYKVADIKTMKFFTEMSPTTLWFLVGVTALSLVYKNVWCRYLCPYGALMGLFSFLSPLKVRRNEEKCIHCGACSRHCPALIDVEKKIVVRSPECFGCMTCVSRCPSAGAIDMTVGTGKEKRFTVRPFLYPVLLLILFYLIIGAGIVTGKWRSAVSYEEYSRIIPEIGRLDHPGGRGF